MHKSALVAIRIAYRGIHVNFAMQTRKKVVARNSDPEHASPKLSRHHKKTTILAGKKVSDVITSSARKQRTAGILPKITKDTDAHSRDEEKSICTEKESSSLYYKQADEKADQYTDTIFSPTFHITKDACAGFCHSDFVNVLEDKDHGCLQLEDLNASKFVCHVSGHEEHTVLENPSLDTSSIRLSTGSFSLECVDEPCQDSLPTEECVEVDEVDEFSDFDPYLFIRNLPDASAVVPTFRPVLLPKQTRSCPSTTLVLDLDETLVHSSLEYCEPVDFTFPIKFNQTVHTVYVRCRPCLNDFLEKVFRLFEVVVFTASQSIYGEQLLNVLDPKRRLFRHRVYRDSCVFVDGNYLKDLSVLGRDLSHVIIVDNSPQAFGFQIDNGIPIESWFDDDQDRALLSLLPFLESLVGVADVRPLIAKEFNLRRKIAAATFPSFAF